MPDMLERIFGKQAHEDDEPAVSPYVHMEGFDAGAVREMEDYYIHLGHMTEADRMVIPADIEFPADDNSEK